MGFPFVCTLLTSFFLCFVFSLLYIVCFVLFFFSHIWLLSKEKQIQKAWSGMGEKVGRCRRSFERGSEFIIWKKNLFSKKKNIIYIPIYFQWNWTHKKSEIQYTQWTIQKIWQWILKSLPNEFFKGSFKWQAFCKLLRFNFLKIQLLFSSFNFLEHFYFWEKMLLSVSWHEKPDLLYIHKWIRSEEVTSIRTHKKVNWRQKQGLSPTMIFKVF